MNDDREDWQRDYDELAVLDQPLFEAMILRAGIRAVNRNLSLEETAELEHQLVREALAQVRAGGAT